MMVMFAGVPLRATCYDVKVTPDGKFDRDFYTNPVDGIRVGLRARNALSNLPYVVDHANNGENMLVAQSNAVYMFLGRRLNLLGDGGDADLARCEQLLCELMDLRNNMIKKAYPVGDQKDECRQLIEEQVSPNGSLAKLEKWLAAKAVAGGDPNYLVGDRASAPDFHAWEMLDQYTAMARFHNLPEPLDELPLLRGLYDNFAALPQNQKYFASPLAKLPFNQKNAKFGGTPEMTTWTTGQEYDFADVSGLY